MNGTETSYITMSQQETPGPAIYLRLQHCGFFFSLYVKSKSVPKSVIDLKPLATFILVTMKATSTSDLRLAIPEQFKFT